MGTAAGRGGSVAGPVAAPAPPARDGRAGRRLALGAIAVCFVAGLGLRLVLWSRPVSTLDGLFVPDDTYYTLAIARAIARGHGPAISGDTLTGGFQPLLAFLMVPVYWLTDARDVALKVDVLFVVLFDAGTIVLLGWLAWRIAGPVAAIVASLVWAVAPRVIGTALGGLEASQAVFLEVLLLLAWLRARDAPARRGRWVAAGVVGGLAVLARVDALLLVVLLLALEVWSRRPREALRAGIATAAVLAPWWIWSLVTLGTPVPTSGSAAHRLAPVGALSSGSTSVAAAAVTGAPFTSWDDLANRQVSTPLAGAVVLWSAVALLVLGAVLVLRSSSGRPGPAVLTAPAMLFAAGLLVFYGWFAVVWHDLRYLAPVSAVLTLLFAWGTAVLARRRALAVAAPVVAVAISLACSAGGDLRALRNEPAPTRYYDAAKGYRTQARAAVALLPPGARVGAVQSGAITYYGAGRITVVNLDGVVNPDAPDPKDHPALGRYVREQRLEWLVDWPPMILAVVYEGRLGAPVVVEHRVPGDTSELQVVRITRR